MPVERSSYVVRHVAKMPGMTIAGVREAIESRKLKAEKVGPCLSAIACKAHNYRAAHRLLLRRFTDFLFDKLTGMDTSKTVRHEQLEFDADRGHHYAASSWFKLFDLHRILRDIAISEDDVFIDFGSGKGRVLFVAAHYGFHKVIGVELSAKLNQIASRNIAKNQHRLVCKDVELVTVDAAQYDIPDDVTVAYFYNPFGGHVFSDVVDRIRASLVRNPRDFRLIYVNPVMHDYLIHSGFRVVRKVRHSTLYTMAT
jgi:SAM-dependent methyltransferase